MNGEIEGPGHLSLFYIYIYNLGDTHSKHGTSGWHKRSPGNSGEGDGDPHNPMPRLSVCADSHKVDRSKLAQTEVCSKFFFFLKMIENYPNFIYIFCSFQLLNLMEIHLAFY